MIGNPSTWRCAERMRGNNSRHLNLKWFRNWSVKRRIPGAPIFVLDFSSPDFFPRPFRLFLAPTNCPWVSEDATWTKVSIWWNSPREGSSWLKIQLPLCQACIWTSVEFNPIYVALITRVAMEKPWHFLTGYQITWPLKINHMCSRITDDIRLQILASLQGN